MGRSLSVLLCTAIVLMAFPGGRADARAGSHVAQWRTFFAQTLPLAPKNFSSIRGAYMPKDDVYATKARFDAKLFANCHVFSTGAKVEWHLRCDTLGYTSMDALTADVGAALPGFTKGANMMGQARWHDKRRQIFVTIVAFGGVLISHGDPDADD